MKKHVRLHDYHSSIICENCGKEYFSKSGLEHRKIKVHEVYEFNLCEKVSFL